MAVATVLSRAVLGIEAPLVTVEVDISGGLPHLSIVGLPEAAVRESKDRVRSALLNSRFPWPDGRITVNLAPADLPKHGGRFDLPIALGVVAAHGRVPHEALVDIEFVGELGLTGELRPVGGVLPAALRARDAGRALVVCRDDGPEAALVGDARVLVGGTLDDVCGHLLGGPQLRAPPPARPAVAAGLPEDLAEVRGQLRARRALEIAAAGRHNLIMIGPPGTGKTMLACRLPGVLPPMSDDEALETAAVHSVSGARLDPARWGQRPFRAPHHTASGAALVGGGSVPRPGEASLAHHGVLFLDELPEFDRRVLEVLREPLESGRVSVARVARTVDFPARFQLVAAMNPCPCGFLGDGTDRCECAATDVARYRRRISGPLLDRIDLQVETPPSHEDRGAGAGETTAAVRERVRWAYERQLARQGEPNGWLDARGLRRHCALDDADADLLESAIVRLGLSARARNRTLRVARTIADLAGDTPISTTHLMEALSFRELDRFRP